LGEGGNGAQLSLIGLGGSGISLGATFPVGFGRRECFISSAFGRMDKFLDTTATFEGAGRPQPGFVTSLLFWSAADLARESWVRVGCRTPAALVPCLRTPSVVEVDESEVTLDDIEEESAAIEDCLMVGRGTGLGCSSILLVPGLDRAGLEVMLRDNAVC
jgi:hypothetical protein